MIVRHYRLVNYCSPLRFGEGLGVRLRPKDVRRAAPLAEKFISPGFLRCAKSWVTRRLYLKVDMAALDFVEGFIRRSAERNGILRIPIPEQERGDVREHFGLPAVGRAVVPV